MCCFQGFAQTERNRFRGTGSIPSVRMFRFRGTGSEFPDAQPWCFGGVQLVLRLFGNCPVVGKDHFSAGLLRRSMSPGDHNDLDDLEKDDKSFHEVDVSFSKKYHFGRQFDRKNDMNTPVPSFDISRCCAVPRHWAERMDTTTTSLMLRRPEIQAPEVLVAEGVSRLFRLSDIPSWPDPPLSLSKCLLFLFGFEGLGWDQSFGGINSDALSYFPGSIFWGPGGVKLEPDRM